MLWVIILNAVWIGIDVEYNPDPKNDKPDSQTSVFVLVENVFTIIFITELWIRFMAYSKKKYFFTEKHICRWNIFDL